MKIVSAEKKLVYKLVGGCTETVEEVKLAEITHAENENRYKCRSGRVYIVLCSTVFTINVVIVTYYVYSQCYTKKDTPHVDFNTPTQTTIYQTQFLLNIFETSQTN